MNVRGLRTELVAEVFDQMIESVIDVLELGANRGERVLNELQASFKRVS